MRAALVVLVSLFLLFASASCSEAGSSADCTATAADIVAGPTGAAAGTDMSPVEDVVSAIRRPDEDWESALDRETKRHQKGLEAQQTTTSSARTLAQTYADGFDISHLPDWPGTLQAMHEAFRVMRDERLYEHRSSPGMLRRTSWLYPIDGCFVRAAHASQSLVRQKFPKPGKVYAFGRLRTKTDFTSRGWAYWSYHVAAAYEYQGQGMVFDVTVEAARPLSFKEWLGKITKDPYKARVTVCDPYSYSPSQQCRGAVERQERSFLPHQRYYLDREWRSVRALGRDPRKVLGDEPPWMEELIPIVGDDGDTPESPPIPTAPGEFPPAAPACPAAALSSF